ncbi:hypothetical protein ABC642_09670 [Lactobacillus helveticus]|uniref:helix-turn-helix domain-containing protein n=1 Tax=Lactobacillus helveticus TaxID=1587 RepID=UPI0031D53ECA
MHSTVKSCSRLRIIKEVKEFKKHYSLTAHDICNLTGLSTKEISQFLNYPASYSVSTMNKLVTLLNTRISFYYYPHGKRTALIKPNPNVETWFIVPLDYVYKVAKW